MHGKQRVQGGGNKEDLGTDKRSILISSACMQIYTAWEKNQEQLVLHL